MKRFFLYTTTACLGALMFASAHAGQPTPDTNLIDFGSPIAAWLNPSAYGTAEVDGINYDPFNSDQGFTFDESWYTRSYTPSALSYNDGTVIPWETGSALGTQDGTAALPAGYDSINAFNADPPLTGHMGLATDMMRPAGDGNYASYLRIPVSVTRSSSGPIIFEALVDDGAALYLNDEPWLRINCCEELNGTEVDPNVAPWFTTEAFNATGTEDNLVQVVLDSMPRGNHLVAVSLHSNAPTSSDQGFDFRVFTPGNYRPWGVNTSGNWADAANWEIDIAGANEFAMFESSLTGDKTIFTDSNVTLDGIQFESSGSTNIAGTGQINLAGRSGADGSLNVLDGEHQFQVVVNLNKNTDADIAANASIDFNNELTLNDRTLNKLGDGDLIVGNNENSGGGIIDVMAGVLGGGGTVAGDVRVNGGTINPGGVVDALGSSATLTVNGDANVNSGGITLTAYGNNNGDAVSGGGSGTLAFAAGSTLTINTAPGYTPSDGDTIEAFPGWSSISGVTAPNGWEFDPATGTLTFGTIVEPADCDLDGDLDCDIADIDSLVNQPGVTEQQINDWLAAAGTENGFAEPLRLGDANLDGTVDAQDLNQVGQNWLGMDKTWSTGDFNGDDTTDAQDLNSLGQNWLSVVPTTAAAAAVPEPSSLSLLAIALFGLCGLRRRT